MSSDLAPELTPAVDRSSEARRPSVLEHRGTAAVATGLALAAATYALVNLVGGPLGVLVFVALLVLVPTSPVLPTRLALNIALFFGWTPLLWWVSWPVPVNHGAAVLAVAAGVTAAVSVRRSGFAVPRSLMPSVRAADLLLPLAVVASALAVRPWLFVRDAQHALAALLPGADNWAHFGMFMAMRVSGATPLASPNGPDGSAWAFGNYPRGFHGLVASLSEIGAPGLQPGGTAVTVYAHSVGAVIVLAVVLVTATVLSLPGLRDRPWVCLPLLALTWTALLWEPGQKVIANGFANFWLADVAVGVALLLALKDRRPSATVAFAVVGLIVLVSHAWTPLAVLAAPAGLLLLRPCVGRGRRALTGATTLAVVGFGVLASASVLLVLVGRVPVGVLVEVAGGIDGTSPLPTFLLIVAAFVLTLGLPRFLAAGGDGSATGTDVGPGIAARARWLVLTPALAVLMLSALLVAQLHSIGTTSYYFLKLFMGTELVLAVVVPALVALLVVGLVKPVGRRGLALSVVLTTLATMAFGVVRPGDALLFSTTNDGTASIEAPYTSTEMARGILAAVGSSDTTRSLVQDYVPLGPGNAAQMFYPDAWFHAITGSTTDDVMERFDPLRHKALSIGEAAPLMRDMVSRSPSVTFVVAPDQVDAVRAAVPDASVESWAR